jgi:hypothetical protein
MGKEALACGLLILVLAKSQLPKANSQFFALANG